MEAKDVIRKALFEVYSIEEIKQSPKSVDLKDIDEVYKYFAIEQAFYNHSDEIFYFIVNLYLKEYDGTLVPLVGVSNIGCGPEEAINIIAEVMERTKIWVDWKKS